MSGAALLNCEKCVRLMCWVRRMVFVCCEEVLRITACLLTEALSKKAEYVGVSAYHVVGVEDLAKQLRNGPVGLYGWVGPAEVHRHLEDTLAVQ